MESLSDADRATLDEINRALDPKLGGGKDMFKDLSKIQEAAEIIEKVDKGAAAKLLMKALGNINQNRAAIRETIGGFSGIIDAEFKPLPE